MAEDLNREEPRFSRSGRVLKKTLKMKEMEDFEIKDGRQDKVHRHMIHPSKLHKLGDKQIQYLVDEGRESNSIGSLNLSISSDISCTDELYSTPRRESSSSSSSSQKTVEIHQLNDAYPSDEDRTWSTSEDTSSNNESEEKSGEYLKVHFKKLRLKKYLKTNYAKFRKFPNLKHKARRKTTAAAKRICTQIKTSEHGIAASSYYSQRKNAEIEDINKMLHFIKLCQRQGGAHTISNEKKEAGDTERDCLQHFESFSKEIRSKSPTSDIVTDQLALQEHQQSSEQLESNPVLGTSPIDVAAYLVLLGNNLSGIGRAVSNLDRIRPGVYSTLLDILLCSVGPLLCLTREIAGLERLPEDVFSKILDHIGYIIPGM